MRTIKLHATSSTERESSPIHLGTCFSINFSNNSQTPALANKTLEFSVEIMNLFI